MFTYLSPAAASDKVYQLLAHDRWSVSPGTPASFTTKTGRHDIAEILLKVALNTSNQNQTIFVSSYLTCSLSISMQSYDNSGLHVSAVYTLVSHRGQTRVSCYYYKTV